MSIESSGTKRTRSVRTLICPSAAAVRARDRPSHYGHQGALFFGAGEGQALALRAPGRAFFFGAGEGQALALRAPGPVFS